MFILISHGEFCCWFSQYQNVTLCASAQEQTFQSSQEEAEGKDFTNIEENRREKKAT